MFDFLKNLSRTDINEIAQEVRNDPAALLLDVRTVEEYAAGHIPGSRSLPLDCADRITTLAPDRSTRLAVYCRSGARSAQAAALFARLGYTNVVNAGGIIAYRGDLEP